MKFIIDDNAVPDISNNDYNPMQKLEEALVMCKFGRFHKKLLCTTLCAVIATTMVTTTSSYILPNAECDLRLTIMEKGWLIAIPFLGQVTVAPLTGFITDAFGRKVFLVGGHIGIFFCSIVEGVSQTYWVLMVGKFVEGISLSFCLSTIAAMVSEFTDKDVRNRALLVYSSFLPISFIVAALMSWLVLTRRWHFIVIEGHIELHSWNIYLLVCSTWSLISAVSYYFLPESPKFLLSHGQEKKALEILKGIYSQNTGNQKETFPMASLYVPNTYLPLKKHAVRMQLAVALFEVKALFRKPLLSRLLLISFMSATSLFAYTALRLWYPQLSTIIESYQEKHSEGAQFCVMINGYKRENNDSLESINIADPETCIPHINGFATYLNGMVMGLISLAFICISGYSIGFVGLKILIFVPLILCAICSGSMYWTYSSIQISVLVSAACAFMLTASSFKTALLLRTFPTTVRSLAYSMMMMAGRSGSLLGNVLFPVMLQGGCMSPFLTLSVIALCVAGLVYFLPDPDKNDNGNGDK